jgi:hypothetical protein
MDFAIRDINIDPFNTECNTGFTVLTDAGIEIFGLGMRMHSTE